MAGPDPRPFTLSSLKCHFFLFLSLTGYVKIHSIKNPGQDDDFNDREDNNSHWEIVCLPFSTFLIA